MFRNIGQGQGQDQGQGQGQGQDQKWRQRSALRLQMVLALTLTLVLVLTLALAPSGMLSKKGVPTFFPSTVGVVVVVVVVVVAGVHGARQLAKAILILPFTSSRLSFLNTNDHEFSIP